MMAALIGWTQTESFALDGESTMHAYLPIPRLRNPQTSAQLFGIDPGLHKGVGSNGVGNAQVCKSFVDSTDVTPVAASSCCSIEITCNHVNLVTQHNGTDCENELFRNTPFFCVDIVNMRDRTVNVF